MIFSCTSFKCLCHDEGRGPIGLAGTAYQSLSPEEQKRVDEIVYGYSESEVKETPEFIEMMLDELDRELSLLSEESRKYYMKAVGMEQMQLMDDEEEEVGNCEEYIGSEQFRLQFLRADLYDAPAAARRLVEYFYHKFELFGEESLGRRITQADLNEGEKEALVSGAMTYTGASDMAGRPVLIIRRHNMFRFSVTCMKRIFFYVFQTAIEDNEKGQRKGFVVLLYHMDMPFVVNPSLARAYHPVARMAQHGLPIRNASVHIYYNDIRDHLLINLALVLITKNERARVLTHYKHSHHECMVDVMTYGINPDQLPLTDEGDFHYEAINEYWEKQRCLKEESSY